VMHFACLARRPFFLVLGRGIFPSCVAEFFDCICMQPFYDFGSYILMGTIVFRFSVSNRGNLAFSAIESGMTKSPS
jgi:hypothetical protein